MSNCCCIYPALPIKNQVLSIASLLTCRINSLVMKLASSSLLEPGFCWKSKNPNERLRGEEGRWGGEEGWKLLTRFFLQHVTSNLTYMGKTWGYTVIKFLKLLRITTNDFYTSSIVQVDSDYNTRYTSNLYQKNSTRNLNQTSERSKSNYNSLMSSCRQYNTQFLKWVCALATPVHPTHKHELPTAS